MGDLPSFSELLRHHRLERGLTQSELASTAGLSTSYVTLMETGRRDNPSWSTVSAVVAALGLPKRETEALYQAAGYPPASGTSPRPAVPTHPVLSTLEKYLSLPSNSPESLDVLRRAIDELLARASQRRERSQEKEEVRRFGLERLAYFHREPPREARLSRTRRLEMRIATHLKGLADVFADPRIPLDRRVALARDVLADARARADAIPTRRKKAGDRGPRAHRNKGRP